MKKIVILVVCFILCFVGTSFAEYKDNGDSTITDTSTGLIWQKHGTYGSYSRSYADQYIDDLNLVGPCKTWRLPKWKEIQNIYQYIIKRPDFNITEMYWVDGDIQESAASALGFMDMGSYGISFAPPGLLTQRSCLEKVYEV